VHLVAPGKLADDAPSCTIPERRSVGGICIWWAVLCMREWDVFAGQSR
jgi:hypothetical protein